MALFASWDTLCRDQATFEGGHSVEDNVAVR